MKIRELEDKLEDLGNDLQIISETVTAVEIAVSNGELKQENTCWALFGIARNAKKAIKDIEELTKEAINMRRTIEKV